MHGSGLLIPGLPLPIGVRRVASGGGGSSDPHYANVVFLWEAEGTDGQTGTYPDGTGKTITQAGTGHIEQDQKRLGSTSYFVGTGGFTVPTSTGWDLSPLNTSPFTIEYSVYQGSLETWETWLRFGSSPNKSWWVRHQSDGQIRFLASSDGSTSFTMDVTTTGFGLGTGAWHDICIEKDATGKIRFYRNSVFKFSNTPANSVFFAATEQLSLSAKTSADAYVDHIRFTKGVARYESDVGYTFVESAWPTS